MIASLRVSADICRDNAAGFSIGHPLVFNIGNDQEIFTRAHFNMIPANLLAGFLVRQSQIMWVCSDAGC